MKRLPPIAERLLAAVGLALGFLFMASIFVPDWSLAEGEPARIARPADPRGQTLVEQHAPSVDPHEGLVSLGSIESEEYTIRIYGNADQPLYSIYTTDGELLATLLTADRVAELFPELPLPNLEFDALGPMMYAGE